MTSLVEARLDDLRLTLPQATAPLANYVPWVRTGNLVVISGQLPLKDGAVTTSGLLGRDVSIEDGQAAAQLCAVNLLAHLKAACEGDLDRVCRVVRLAGFVAATPEFIDHPKVINGASDLMAAVFADAGRHARAAVGCSSLPLGACVEVEGMFELRA